METFEAAVCFKTIKVVGDVVNKPLPVVKAEKSLHALMTAIYSNLFDVIVQNINESISIESSERSQKASISVLDIFGFESFARNSFEQLCINFTNETLQQQFNRYIFTLEQEEYEREGIIWSFIDFPDNEDVLTLIDGRHPSIMTILDEQCIMPKSSDAKFARSLYKNLGKDR